MVDNVCSRWRLRRDLPEIEAYPRDYLISYEEALEAMQEADRALSVLNGRARGLLRDGGIEIVPPDGLAPAHETERLLNIIDPLAKGRE